jgi:antitoxin YefM
MKAITYTTARQNLAKTMEKVCKDHSPVIITRKTNDSVVIMSLEDYEALEETAYLLRSPKNTRRLIESIAQLEEGQGVERALLDWSSYFQIMPGRITYTGKSLTKKSSSELTASSRRSNVIHSKVWENPSHSNTPYQDIGLDESMMSTE